MAALVGTEREREAAAFERHIVCRRQRLFHHLDSERGESRQQLIQHRRRPAFVRIDDQPRIGRVGADCLDAREVAFAGDLELEQREVRVPGRGLTHILGCIEAECDGGDAGLWPIEACQCPGRAARLLRFQVPERAVERVASGAGRQRVQQAFAGKPALHSLARVLDLRARSRRCLVIAGIGDGLATAGVGAVGDFGDDDVRLRLRPAGDAEGALERPRFEAHGEAPPHGSGPLNHAVGDWAHAGADGIDAGQAVRLAQLG